MKLSQAFSQSRRLGLVLLCLASSWSACARLDGAAEVDAPDLLPWPASPLGDLVAGRSLVVAPGRNFSPTQDGAAWKFRLWAQAVCRVLEATDQPLGFFFQPGPEESDLWFRLYWDDQEIGGGGGGHEVRGRVPAQLITPGDHILKVRRLFADRPVGEVRIEHFGFRLGEEEVLFLPSQVERLRMLDDFLSVGVASNTRQKFGGLLFSGPGATHRALPEVPASHLRFQLLNLSSEAAHFVARVADRDYRQEVSPGSTQPLEIPLPAGEHKLELEVEGSDEGLFLWGEPGLTPRGTSGATPIFLITLDTTRRDALSPYGGPEELSPRIGQLARQATVYENAFSTSPWTLPSHASIMTGLYPSRHLAGVEDQHLTSRVSTMATLLARAGYATAGFAGGALCAHRFGISHGFGRYLNPDSFESTGDRLTAEVGEFLSQRYKQPLFVFINYFDPHGMYRAPTEFQELAGVSAKRDALDGHPLWQALDRGQAPAWRSILQGESTITPEILDYLQAAYLSEVAFMDSQIGRLLDRLQELDLFDRALIILVADHGELLGEYGGLFSHAGRLDPELTEIPMIIKWPGQREGQRESALTSQVDLFATVLEVAGLEAPKRDGLSLAGQGPSEDRRLLFMEEHESRVHPLPRRLKIASDVYGVQRDRERLIVWEGGLECARRTPKGWRDEPCRSSREAVLERVQEALGASPPTTEGGTELDEEAREALKALGYL